MPQVTLKIKPVVMHFRTGITTYINPGGVVIEVCHKHEQAWGEGSKFQDRGGLACRECVEAAKLEPGHCPKCFGDKFKTVIKGKLYACRSMLHKEKGVELCGWQGRLG